MRPPRMTPNVAHRTKSSKSSAVSGAGPPHSFGIRMIARAYSQPSRMPKIYASAYHRIASGPIETSTGSKAGNGMAKSGMGMLWRREPPDGAAARPGQARRAGRALAGRHDDPHCDTG